MSDADGRDGDAPGNGDEEGDGWRFDPDEGETPDRQPSETPPEDEEEGWRFSLEEVDEDGIVRRSIEPGEIDLENALFVVLGAVAMVVVVYQLWTLLT